MKKLFLSMLLITSITFLTACNTTTKDNSSNAQQKQSNIEVIKEISGPNGTKLIKIKRPDNSGVDMVKEKYKDGKLIEARVESTFPDGKSEKFIDKFTSDQNGNIIRKDRKYDDGRKETIDIKKVSENKTIENTKIERPDGSKESLVREIIRNSNGTTTVKTIQQQ